MNKNTLCHCNLKENAELIAMILDSDVNGEKFSFDVRDPFAEVHSFVTRLRETLQDEKDIYFQEWKDEEDMDKRFRLNMAIGVQKRCLVMLDDILFYLKTGEPPFKKTKEMWGEADA